MSALAAAVAAVLPAFLLIGAGALADRWLRGLHLETLARLSVQLLIPALVLGALATTDLTLGGAARLGLAYLAYLVALGALAVAGTHGLEPVARRGAIVTAVFGNTGNMGLPITLFAYGAAGLERAVVLLVASLAVMFVVGPALLAGGGDWRERAREALRLPPLWATLGGVLLNLLDWRLPLPLERGVALLGDAAIPVMLLSLGMQMRRSWTWSVDGPALRSGALRLLAGPFVAWGAAVLLGLADLDRKVLVLSAAMPAAVTMFVVAVEVGGDARGVGRSVVVTTLGSVLAIGAVLLLLPPG